MVKKLGVYAFMAGILISIVLGIASPSLGSSQAYLTSFLIGAGILVGLLNITGKEAKDFLMMSSVVVLMSFAGNASQIFGSVLILGPYLSGIFSSMLLFVVPATILTALKNIWALGKD